MLWAIILFNSTIPYSSLNKNATEWIGPHGPPEMAEGFRQIPRQFCDYRS
jgi:hypothetical protein